MERDWIWELERWLEKKFGAACRALGYAVPPSGIRIYPALELKEAEYFLLGMEADLFRVDDEGRIQSDLLARTSGENESVSQIFCQGPLPPRLFREGVCRLAAASFLVLERGWPKAQVLIEPAIEEHHPSAEAVDMVVQSASGEILICAEVKRNGAELGKLIRDLRVCCQRGRHGRDDCGFPQNHPTYEFCASYKPAYFWAVAPDGDVCFKMRYSDGVIELDELSSLLQRSMIESS
jgi:hypothetical protein